jgi:proprotein convertase subtilisin/kexin type 2
MKSNRCVHIVHFIYTVYFPIFLIVACASGGGGESDHTSNQDASTTIISNRTYTVSIQNKQTINYSLKPSITILFNESIDLNSATTHQIRLFDQTTQQSINLHLNLTATKINASYNDPLVVGHSYRLDLIDIKKLNGSSQTPPQESISFTMAADTVAPNVQSVLLVPSSQSSHYNVLVQLSEEPNNMAQARLMSVLTQSSAQPQAQALNCAVPGPGTQASEILFTVSTPNCFEVGKQYQLDLNSIQDFGGNVAQSSGQLQEVFTMPSVCGSQSQPINITDSIFSLQWHIQNRASNGSPPNGGAAALSGEDLNIKPVWEQQCQGDNIYVAVVDDGLYINHPDLSPNVAPGLSYNYSTSSADPSGGGHGTAVAGLIASPINNLGVVGVAPKAKLMGFNMLQASSVNNIADAMTRQINLVNVSNNSWGYIDHLGYIDSPSTWKSAVDLGVSQGRNGKGIVYLFAAGNGSEGDTWWDNSNYDGFANYRNVLAVGGVDSAGKWAKYSEQGANVLVAGPTMQDVRNGNNNGQFDGLYTTYPPGQGNLNAHGVYAFNGNYYSSFNGTSGSTPTVAGVVAILLQMNPNLTWRDVRWILAKTARKNDPTDNDWASSAIGQGFNHKYGFGVPNALAALNEARQFSPLSSYKSCSSTLLNYNNSPIIYGQTGSISVGNNAFTNCRITIIEFVELSLSINGNPQQLAIRLISPAGQISRLSEYHICPNSCYINNGWTFGSVRHLGESRAGTWRIEIENNQPSAPNQYVGYLHGFTQNTKYLTKAQLVFYGH